MRSLPRISLSGHGLALLVTGILLVGLAFVADLGEAGTLLTLIAGFALSGAGLGAASAMPLHVQQSLDRLLVVALAGLAVVCALAGSAPAAILLLVTGGVVLWLESATRWTRPLR